MSIDPTDNIADLCRGSSSTGKSMLPRATLRDQNTALQVTTSLLNVPSVSDRNIYGYDFIL